MASTPTTAMTAAAVTCGSRQARSRYSFIVCIDCRQYRCSIVLTSAALRRALDYTVLHLHPAGAEFRDQPFRMARQDDDRGAVEKVLDALLRLFLERRVAGAHPLVDQQDVVTRGGRDREGEPREHADWRAFSTTCRVRHQP